MYDPGKMQVKFEETISYFVNAVPTSLLDEIQNPSWKTLSDRFKNDNGCLHDYEERERGCNRYFGKIWGEGAVTG